MAEPRRFALFVDYQNTYHGARETFHDRNAPSAWGQVFPAEIARLICARPTPSGERIVSDVRVYLGRPSQQRDPKGYAASRKQIAVWEAQGVKVFPRTLRYPRDDALPPQEKGIDVSLAIDFAAGAVDNSFDVGVILSTDTDLVPALEFVADRPGLNVTPEVAAWWGDGANAPLRLSGRHLWCHRLTLEDYERVRDRRSYVRDSDQ
jgi:uncharacterized LabA/DUF88 family protein